MAKLDARQLRTACDVAQFDFQTTAELEDLDEIVGQRRAIDAIRFGIGIGGDGFNLFAMGPSGVGKHHALSLFLSESAPGRPTPLSWCYVHNFEDPRAPKTISMKPSGATQARQALEELVTEIEVAIRSVLEGDDFRSRRLVLHTEFDQRHEDALEAIARDAEERGWVLEQTAEGFTILPVIDGELATPEQLEALTDEEQEELDTNHAELAAALRSTLDDFPAWDRERRHAIVDLQSSCVSTAVAPLFVRLRKQFEDNEAFVEHLDALEESLVKDPAPFLPAGEDDEPALEHGRHRGVERFSVNVVVDHAPGSGAPIVYEDDPTVDNLHGAVEYDTMMGGLTTNFALIRAGSLHRANGGYLVVDARKLLSDPHSWNELKRTLYAGEIRIPSQAEATLAPRALSLDPDTIPLSIKVVMVGERETYYALRELDPDMDELFKVMADFDTEMERTPETVGAYARLIGTFGRTEGLRPFEREAVGRVVEECARMAQHAEKLSTHMRSVVDLLRASDYWAAEDLGENVTADHVERALTQERIRNGRIADAMLEQTTNGIVHIETEGGAIGQLNGLSVIMFGPTEFGRPSRITATASPGRDVVDIERESDLGGPIHSKGVMILKGFLSHRFGRDEPVNLAATLAFEQSYGPVDGDSASAGEACALLSALAEIPIQQNLALTGAIDQRGRIQAVGGVDAKIEGFFDLCESRGLTGEHGVLIPQSNVAGLMLDQRVVDAVGAGKFSIFAVGHLDEAIELLTQKSSDEVNAAVAARLHQFAKANQSFR